MEPIAYAPKKGKGLVLFFRCLKCAAVRSNTADLTGESPDTYEKILQLSGQSPLVTANARPLDF